MNKVIIIIAFLFSCLSFAATSSGINCKAYSNAGPKNSQTQTEINLGQNSPRTIDGIYYDRYRFQIESHNFFVLTGSNGSLKLTQDLSHSGLDMENVNNSLIAVIAEKSEAQLQTFTNNTTVVVNCTRK